MKKNNQERICIMVPYTVREFFMDNDEPVTYKQNWQDGRSAYNLYIDGRKIKNAIDFYGYINDVLKHNAQTAYSKCCIAGLSEFCSIMKNIHFYIKSENIILTFDYYDLFLQNDISFKKELEYVLDNDILPFYKNMNLAMATQNLNPVFSVYCRFSSKSNFMLHNRRIFITKTKKNSIIKKYIKDSRALMLYIDGNYVVDKEQYEKFLLNHLNAPESIKYSLDAYSDMMCDEYSYYKKDPIVWIIENYKNFLCENKKYKDEIEYLFDKIILPYFEKEVEEIAVGGRRTSYTVYCIN